MRDDEERQGQAERESDRSVSQDRELQALESSLRWAQESQALAVRILNLLNQDMPGKEVIRRVLGMVQEFTGFEAVAIRLREGDDFPYFVTNGFPDYFVEAERYLCDRNEAGEIVRDADGNPVLECMCGNILCGRTDPSYSFFTDGGSFWSCHTTELLATTTDANRQTRTRNRCNASGYESVALIPLRSDRETIGLLQLNDSRKDCFTQDMIAFFEGIGASIGIVLARVKTEEALRQSREELETNVMERTEELRKANEMLHLEVPDRKRAEERLREYERVVEGLEEMVAVVDRDYRYVIANRSFLSYRGLKSEQLVGHLVPEILGKEVFDKVIKERVDRCLQGNVVKYEMRYNYDKLGERDLSISYLPIEGPVGVNRVACVLYDVTDRKRAERALRESEQRYRAVFNIASVGIDLVDRQGKFLEVNKTLSQFLGYTQEELRHLTMLDVTHPEDADRCWEMHEAMVRGQFDDYRLEKRYVRKDGSILWSDTAVSAIRDADGQHRATVGVIRDITAQKRSEEARIRLATAVEQAVEGIVITDPQGDIQYVNPAYERITGYSRGEMIGEKPIFLRSESSPTQQDIIETLARENRWSGHLVEKRKDGATYEEDITVTPVLDLQGNIVNFVVVKRDVTQEASLQRQLLQAQKMEAIGTLAGGVAHDFNNILQVALGYTELLLGDESLPGYSLSDLRKVYDAAKRGADLVERLLTFSRKTEIKPLPLNLNRRIKELQKMLERTFPKMIDIQLALDDGLATIYADPTQTDQVLMNLTVNARDAMPDGGKLTIETSNVLLDEEYAKIHLDAKPGLHVLLTVEDTGTGMDKDTLEHIFEPFYTTKVVGEGTGLGLAMVHGIVKQHGGHVRCYSESGHGTTFRIYFPALVSDEEADQNKVSPLPRGGSETILLVDDEELIRDLGARILTKAGYKVITAASGNEAIEAFRGRAEEICLVVLDLMMPEMGGKRCLEELLGVDPTAKVVIASGYTANGPAKEALEAGAKGFVSKPYNIRQLMEVVRTVLDED